MNHTQLPKPELHAHLNGCIPTNALLALCRQYEIVTPVGFEFPKDLQVTHPVRGFPEYFRPWQIMKQFPKGRACLEQLIRLAVDAMIADGIVYVEFRYSLSNIVNCNDISLTEALDWLVTSVRALPPELPIETRILLSINRNEANDAYLSSLIESLRSVDISQVVVGLDLTGDEDLPVAEHSSRYFRQAQEDFGLPCSLHAGETGNVENIRWAINNCGAARIAHGLAIARDTSLIQELKCKDVCVEVCLRSNHLTGMAGLYSSHPLQLILREGIPFVLGTDSPGIHSHTLSQEYAHFLSDYGDLSDLANMFEVAGRFAFDRKAYSNVIYGNPIRQFQQTQDT